jgi:hypothetical protein
MIPREIIDAAIEAGIPETELVLVLTGGEYLAATRVGLEKSSLAVKELNESDRAAIKWFVSVPHKPGFVLAFDYEPGKTGRLGYAKIEPVTNSRGGTC